MKILALLLLGIVLVIGVFAFQPKNKLEIPSIAKKTAEPKTTSSDTSGFAVLELFTSEGCSSCPAADKLLATIIDEAKRSGKHIFPIAFHVDYWNSLGWTDRFSSAEYSARQSRYAEQFHLASIYTPQLIVNGNLECTGSNEDQVRHNIDVSLRGTSSEAKPSLSIKLDSILTTVNNFFVDIRAGNYSVGTLLNVVLIENQLHSNIKRGENSGRTLQHENVVRALETVILTNTEYHQMLKLAVPTDAIAAHCSVMVYLQDASTLSIIGAAKL